MSFLIGDRITDRRANAGDKVTAGATLAQLDPVDYELEPVEAEAEAEAKMAAATAEKSKAHKDPQRYKELLKKDLVSKADLSDLANKLRVVP